MNKIGKTLLTMVVLTATSVMAIAHITPISYSTYQDSIEIVNIRHVDETTLKGVMEGKLPHIALEISKGERLPLFSFLKGDFVEIENNGYFALFVKVQKDIYLRNVDDQFLFSTHASEWTPLKDFITGNASIALELNEFSQPCLKIGAEIYERSTGKA